MPPKAEPDPSLESGPGKHKNQKKPSTIQGHWSNLSKLGHRLDTGRQEQVKAKSLRQDNGIGTVHCAREGPAFQRCSLKCLGKSGRTSATQKQFSTNHADKRPRMHLGSSAGGWRMWVKELPRFQVRFLRSSLSSEISKIKSWVRSVVVSSWWWGKGLTTTGHGELSGVREVLCTSFVVVVM